jgi:hypothetical protein
MLEFSLFLGVVDYRLPKQKFSCIVGLLRFIVILRSIKKS